MSEALSAYYSFVIALIVLGFLPLYVVGKWKQYYEEKQRQKTMREAMRN